MIWQPFLNIREEERNVPTVATDRMHPVLCNELQMFINWVTDSFRCIHAKRNNKQKPKIWLKLILEKMLSNYYPFKKTEKASSSWAQQYDLTFVLLFLCSLLCSTNKGGLLLVLVKALWTISVWKIFHILDNLSYNVLWPLNLIQLLCHPPPLPTSPNHWQMPFFSSRSKS